MSEAIERLRAGVRAWYRQELAHVADGFEEGGDPGKLDFGELVRRAQVVFACELIELTKDNSVEVRLEPGSPDYAQLERVTQAMRARGLEVPDSMKQALGEDKED